MIRSIKGFGCVEGLLPGVLAAALAVALASCKTTQPTEMSASLGVAAEGEPSALSLAERYRAHPDDPDAAINYAWVLRGVGQYAQALAVLERASKEHPNDRRVLAAYGRALAHHVRHNFVFWPEKRRIDLLLVLVVRAHGRNENPRRHVFLMDKELLCRGAGHANIALP